MMKNDQTTKQEPAPLAAGDLRSYRLLLARNPRYRKFWLAGIISQLGNWFNYIAIFVLLNQLTGTGSAVSWFLIAKFLPTAFLGPAAGVLADRFSRKTIMVLCDLVRVFVVLGFLLVDSPDKVWLVYALALVQESVWSFYDPARRASVPNLVGRGELNVANALSGATWSLMLAFGAAAGGFVTASLGWQAAILIDAATFAISAGLLASIPLPPPPKRGATRTGWRAYTGIDDFIEGFRYVAGHPRVAGRLLVKGGWASAGGILVLLTVFGEQVFQAAGQGTGSGILYSARGIGAAIGPILAWRLMGESRKAMHRAIGFAFFVAGLAYIGFSQAPSLMVAVPFVLLGHMGGSVQWIFSTTLLQRTVEDRYRGRVFAAEMALLTLVLSLSTFLTGVALDSGIPPREVALKLALLFFVPGSVWTIIDRNNNRKPPRGAGK